MEHYLTKSQPWIDFRSSNSTQHLFHFSASSIPEHADTGTWPIQLLGRSEIESLGDHENISFTSTTRVSSPVLWVSTLCGFSLSLCCNYHTCFLTSALKTQSALTNTSVLTWRSGIHLQDAYATPWVVPNEVANRCWQACLGSCECREGPSVVRPAYFNMATTLRPHSRVHGRSRAECVTRRCVRVLSVVLGPWSVRFVGWANWVDCRCFLFFFGVPRRCQAFGAFSV